MKNTVTYFSRHTTVYRYATPVTISHHAAHLIPRTLSRQMVHSSALNISPKPTHLARRRDYFGNHVVFFTLEEVHRMLTVESVCTITVRKQEVPLPDDTPSWEQTQSHLVSNLSPETIEASQYLFDTPFVTINTEITEYARHSFSPGRAVLSAVIDLMHRIYCDFTYDPTATTLTTPLTEVLKYRRGVCQDFSHLQIACCRSIGLAARYVSGYLRTHQREQFTGTESNQQPVLVGADASHAWLAIYIPGTGWIDLDPTNNIIPSVEHVTIAWGRDYDDVSPLKGVMVGGGKHSISVDVSVTPYNAEQQVRALS